MNIICASYQFSIVVTIVDPNWICLIKHSIKVCTWWCHQRETFSALLALCEGNPQVISGFPSQRPVMQSFDVFFDVCLNKQLSKQSRYWWFEKAFIITSLWWANEINIWKQGSFWVWANDRYLQVTFSNAFSSMKTLHENLICLFKLALVYMMAWCH